MQKKVKIHQNSKRLEYKLALDKIFIFILTPYLYQSLEC